METGFSFALYMVGMTGFGWDKLKISNEVGLPISVIDKII